MVIDLPLTCATGPSVKSTTFQKQHELNTYTAKTQTFLCLLVITQSKRSLGLIQSIRRMIQNELTKGGDEANR